MVRWILNWTAGVGMVLCLLVLGLMVFAPQQERINIKGKKGGPASAWHFSRGGFYLCRGSSWPRDEERAFAGKNLALGVGCDEPSFSIGALEFRSGPVYLIHHTHWNMDYVTVKYQPGRKGGIWAEDGGMGWSVDLRFEEMAIITGSLPVIWLIVQGLRMWRRYRRNRPHAGDQLCSVCGYDIRFSPQRCPECGEVVEAAGKSTVGERNCEVF